jgi:translation initiation factor IF-2
MPPCAILTPATSTRRGGEGVLHLTVISRTGKIATIAVVAAATAASLFVWQSVLHTGVQPLSLWPQLPGFASETVDVPLRDHSTGGSASSSSRPPVGAPLRRAQTHRSTPLPNRSRPRRPPPAGKAQPPHPPVTGSQPAPANPETPTAPTPTAPTPTVPTPTAASPAPEPASKPGKSSGRTLALQRANQAGPAKPRATGLEHSSQQTRTHATPPQQPPRADAHVQPQSPQPSGRARAGDHPHPSTPAPPGPPQAQPTAPHTTTPPQPSQEKHDQQPAEPHSSQPPPPAAKAPKPPGHAHP